MHICEFMKIGTIYYITMCYVSNLHTTYLDEVIVDPSLAVALVVSIHKGRVDQSVDYHL